MTLWVGVPEGVSACVALPVAESVGLPVSEPDSVWVGLRVCDTACVGDSLANGVAAAEDV